MNSKTYIALLAVFPAPAIASTGPLLELLLLKFLIFGTIVWAVTLPFAFWSGARKKVSFLLLAFTLDGILAATVIYSVPYVVWAWGNQAGHDEIESFRMLLVALLGSSIAAYISARRILPRFMRFNDSHD